jgi:hypothetical protein
MASAVVLVNGLPGAGKSSLAEALRVHLGVPLLSKDVVKRSLADLIAGTVAPPRLGAIAMDTIWAMAAALPGPVLVESWWFRPRDLDLARSGIALALGGSSRAMLEVWCDVPPDLARHRYLERARIPLHQDDEPTPGTWDAWSRAAAPLGFGPVIRVDTSRPVDLPALAQQIALQALNQAGS